MSEPTSVLFVCLGNICRSPLAEGVLRHLVQERGLGDRFEIDSAGTGDWHMGQPPDERSVQVASAHGITLGGRARRVRREDLDHFDLVVAMDRENLRDLQRLADGSGPRARLHLLSDFDPEADHPDVPDPYYEDLSGFETLYRTVHRACESLLEQLAPPSD
ncbi:MAG: low molecular weight phosphotyrosine protein phosphatase [Gemmatimonadetes bacterium]|nr:low molecular weight phosphotyrosine protein phosphatase [Gemmatimonadota bacterium]